MADDTEKVQALLDAGAPIPKGSYWINALVGVKPKSGTLNLEGVELRALPTNSAHYAIVRVEGVKDLTIMGGRIIGERAQHKGTGGEFGYGVFIMGNSARVTLDGIYIAECWGDGVLISGSTSAVVDSPTVKNCTIYNNRRQGISVGSSKNLTITGCKITHTNGTPPECAIDVEPWTNENVHNVTIIGNNLSDNKGSGCVLSAARGTITGKINVSNNVMARNKNRLPCLRVNNLPGGDNWITDVLAVMGIYRKEYVRIVGGISGELS